MTYYEITFPLTLIFDYNFVKISLLMTCISISISLKTYRSCLKEVIEQFLYIMNFIMIKLSRDITENQKKLSRKNTK